MTLEDYMRDAPNPPGELIRLNFVEGETTRICGEILEAFKADARVMFLVKRGTAPAVLNRIRTRISQVRNAMRAKRILRFHYRMKSYIFPYTNSKGVKCDCIVLHKVVTKIHKITEIAEGVIRNGAVNTGTSGEAKAEALRIERIEW